MRILWRQRKRTLQPTYADALQASRSVMRHGLTQLAFYSPHEDVSQFASEVLAEEKAAYTLGVMMAAD